MRMGNDNDEGMAGEETTTTTTSSGIAGDNGGDEQLAQLRAKIQEKKKKLLKLKHTEQAPAKDQDTSNANAELAAKNALRFSTSTSDRDQSLNKLLPADLKGRSQDKDRSARAEGGG